MPQEQDAPPVTAERVGWVAAFASVLISVVGMVPGLIVVNLLQGIVFAEAGTALHALAGRPSGTSSGFARAVGWTFPIWFLAWAVPVALFSGFAGACNAKPEAGGGFLLAIPPTLVGCAAAYMLTNSKRVLSTMIVTSMALSAIGAGMASRAANGDRIACAVVSILPSAWQIAVVVLMMKWVRRMPREPHCAVCGYDLRGLSDEVRCPECGVQRVPGCADTKEG